MLISTNIGPHTRFAFLHIPRTAGSSVSESFRRMFGWQSVWWHGVEFDMRQLSGDIPDHIRVVGGHFSLTEADRLLQEGFHCLSVVRDPADRIVSYHHLITRTQGHPMQPNLPFREINADLEASHVFRSHNLNQQVRFLSQDWTASSVRQLCERGLLSLATVNEVDAFLCEIAVRVGVPHQRLNRLGDSGNLKPMLAANARQIVSEITVEDRSLFNYVLQFEG